MKLFGHEVSDRQEILQVNIEAMDAGGGQLIVVPTMLTMPEGISFSPHEVARILISTVAMLPVSRVEIATMFLEGADNMTDGIVNDLLARGKAAQELEGVDMDEEIERILGHE
jgi:hypothetical protein